MHHHHHARRQPSKWNILLVVCCLTTRIHSRRTCSHEGPETCAFQTSKEFVRTFCSWDNDGFEFHKDQNSSYHVRLACGKSEGHLTSRLTCGAVNWVSGCFMFYFKFDSTATIDLSVSVKYDGQSQAQTPVWKLSSSPNIWKLASVPLKTKGIFQIVLKAKRRSSEAGSESASPCNLKDSVYIDSLHYELSDTCTVDTPIAPIPIGSDTPQTTPDTREEKKEEKEQYDVYLIVAVVLVTSAVVIAVIDTVVLVWVCRSRKQQRPPNGSALYANGGNSGEVEEMDGIRVYGLDGISHFYEVAH